MVGVWAGSGRASVSGLIQDLDRIELAYGGCGWPRRAREVVVCGCDAQPVCFYLWVRQAAMDNRLSNTLGTVTEGSFRSPYSGRSLMCVARPRQASGSALSLVSWRSPGCVYGLDRWVRASRDLVSSDRPGFSNPFEGSKPKTNEGF